MSCEHSDNQYTCWTCFEEREPLPPMPSLFPTKAELLAEAVERACASLAVVSGIPARVARERLLEALAEFRRSA